MARDIKSHGRPRWRCKNPECGGSVYLDDSIILERVVQKLKVLAHSPACIRLPKAAPASTDALRIENELALCFNRADINPEYMKTLIMAAAAERYAGLERSNAGPPGWHCCGRSWSWNRRTKNPVGTF